MVIFVPQREDEKAGRRIDPKYDACIYRNSEYGIRENTISLFGFKKDANCGAASTPTSPSHQNRHDVQYHDKSTNYEHRSNIKRYFFAVLQPIVP